MTNIKAKTLRQNSKKSIMPDNDSSSVRIKFEVRILSLEINLQLFSVLRGPDLPATFYPHGKRHIEQSWVQT